MLRRHEPVAQGSRLLGLGWAGRRVSAKKAVGVPTPRSLGWMLSAAVVGRLRWRRRRRR